LLRAEWAAGEVAIADLYGGNFAAAVVDAQNQGFGFGISIDYHFHEFDAAFFQKGFRAATIGTPNRAIHDDRFVELLTHLELDAREFAWA
jgi:hypothetical protein